MKITRRGTVMAALANRSAGERSKAMLKPLYARSDRGGHVHRVIPLGRLVAMPGAEVVPGLQVGDAAGVPA